MTPSQWGTAAITGVVGGFIAGSIGAVVQAFFGDPETAEKIFSGFFLTGLVIGLVWGWFHARGTPYL
jgi:hypothetical protein